MTKHPWDQWLEDAKRQQKERVKAEKAERPKGQRCGTCAYVMFHPYSERYNYCTKQVSTRTSNGYATTKRGNWCEKWTPTTNKP